MDTKSLFKNIGIDILSSRILDNQTVFLDENQLKTLIEIPIFLGAFYGLRRSEALGLKWDAIDFQNNTITIRHTVTSCTLDGKHIQIAQDTTKTKSSIDAILKELR